MWLSQAYWMQRFDVELGDEMRSAIRAITSWGGDRTGKVALNRRRRELEVVIRRLGVAPGQWTVERDSRAADGATWSTLTERLLAVQQDLAALRDSVSGRIARERLPEAMEVNEAVRKALEAWRTQELR
jgi:plasmid stabilization system protein ParE